MFVSVNVFTCARPVRKIPWDETIYIDVQAIHGGSTKGVAVHGTLKTDKVKAKLKKEKESGDDD